MVPLKNLNNFWRTLEMPLINCEFSIQLKWSRKYRMYDSRYYRKELKSKFSNK